MNTDLPNKTTRKANDFNFCLRIFFPFGADSTIYVQYFEICAPAHTDVQFYLSQVHHFKFLQVLNSLGILKNYCRENTEKSFIPTL